MSAASIFEFKFDADNATEGVKLATDVGTDMTKTVGYLRHEVVLDVTDSGHVSVITFWNEQAQGEAVLGKYINDAKIKTATDLAGAAPSGFLGVVQ